MSSNHSNTDPPPPKPPFNPQPVTLHYSSSTAAFVVSSPSRFRLFSSDEKASQPPSIKDTAPVEIEDVDNKELKSQIDKYLKGDEQMLPSILEAIMQRELSGKHEDTDNELMEELSMKPIDDVDDQDFEFDFEDLHETDEEICFVC
ncbi:unnamed protein product [Lathyrus sativus]|nr:unnamed protein product [Lathyrus sativus]